MRCALEQPLSTRIWPPRTAYLSQRTPQAHQAPAQHWGGVPDQALERACGVVTAHLYEFATDRNASHVARRLLCVAAGRDVLPAAGRAAGGVDGASHGKVNTEALHVL